MTNRPLFTQISIATDFPQLPFNYHEPITSVEKNGKSYRVYYTITREIHILIIETYDGAESYYRSFDDKNFMVDGTFQLSSDLPVILKTIDVGFKVVNVDQLRNKLSETVEKIFGKK